MPLAPRRLATLVAACGLAAVAAAALHRVPVLEVENRERGRSVVIPLAPGESFAVTSHHSMYDAPVTERFTLGAGGRIVLREVSSPSAAAREYLGIAAAGERHAVERVMPEVVFRVAAGEAQRLTAGGRERSFLTFGEHGDRVVMRASTRSLLAHTLAPPASAP